MAMVMCPESELVEHGADNWRAAATDGDRAVKEEDGLLGFGVGVVEVATREVTLVRVEDVTFCEGSATSDMGEGPTLAVPGRV